MLAELDQKRAELDRLKQQKAEQEARLKAADLKFTFAYVVHNYFSILYFSRREQGMLDTLTGLTQFVATDTGVSGGFILSIMTELLSFSSFLVFLQ